MLRMTPDDYKQAAREKAEYQVRVKAKWQAARLAEIHTAKDDYICDCCGKTIPKNTRYRRQKIAVSYGWPEGAHFTERITHVVCSKEDSQ